MRLRIHIDGGSRGNPGPAAAATVIFDAESGKLLHEAGYFLGRTTNNVAEYHGLLRALETAQALKADGIEILSDSELMVRQINGQYKVKSPDLQPLFTQARQLLGGVGSWRMDHVYRERNARADELANRALDSGRDVIVKSVLPQGGDEAAEPAAATPGAAAEAESPAREICWTAELIGAATDSCPAHCPGGEPFVFGATTPADLCVHAAKAALAAGPVNGWPASKEQVSTACGHCGRVIRIRRKS
jgi:ribonuclease HI